MWSQQTGGPYTESRREKGIQKMRVVLQKGIDIVWPLWNTECKEKKIKSELQKDGLNKGWSYYKGIHMDIPLYCNVTTPLALVSVLL